MRATHLMQMFHFNEALYWVTMTCRAHWNGNVLIKVDGPVLRKVDCLVLRRA